MIFFDIVYVAELGLSVVKVPAYIKRAIDADVNVPDAGDTFIKYGLLAFIIVLILLLFLLIYPLYMLLIILHLIV
jgi:hypothetical protein